MSSVNRVYENTRKSIIGGSVPPGSPLKINDLAMQNDVSLIPVREAIRMLASDGLVEVIPNRGAFVSKVSMDDLVDIYQTRIVLEMEALRQAAPHIGPDKISLGRNLIERIVDLIGRGDEKAFVIHREFHFLLYEPSGSRWLLQLINMLWDHTERYRRFSMPRVEPITIVEEHGLILDCLEAGTAAGATEALRTHLEKSIQFHYTYDFAARALGSEGE